MVSKKTLSPYIYIYLLHLMTVVVDAFVIHYGKTPLPLLPLHRTTHITRRFLFFYSPLPGLRLVRLVFRWGVKIQCLIAKAFP